ncbi:hypothetical protein FACS1894137_12770 [Spirochaetia bacterium]|nr:hypothetical protein FACS1894137_12770 [Spirochaetia bacterium]
MAEKTIVITTFGQGDTVERISVSLFDTNDSNDYSQGARNYCKAINRLELKDGTWVFARIVSEHAQHMVKKLVPGRTLFTDTIPKLNDREIQRVLREVDKQDLVVALKGMDGDLQDKIFCNLTKMAAEMLKEDMEFMGPVREDDVKARHEKLADIIQNLDAAGEIVIPDPDEKTIV